jgi:hypothetical protein
MDIKITIRGVKQTVAEVEREVSRVVDTIANDTLEVAISKTPIDKGRARRGWNLDKGPGMERNISNRVPYIVHLEDGHSKQAPNGILGPTIREIAKRRYR